MEEDKKNKSQAVIEVIDSGPLKITGNFVLTDLQRGKETIADEVHLCRCGKSCDKPFCDESHNKK